MSAKLKRMIIVSAGFWVVYFVLSTTFAAVNPFPLSACLAPWGWRQHGDQGLRNWDVCVVEIARYRKDVSLCERFPSRVGCVAAVAESGQDPTICFQSFLTEVESYRCLLDFHQRLERVEVCQAFGNASQEDICIRAAEEAMGFQKAAK